MSCEFSFLFNFYNLIALIYTLMAFSRPKYWLSLYSTPQLFELKSAYWEDEIWNFNFIVLIYIYIYRSNLPSTLTKRSQWVIRVMRLKNGSNHSMGMFELPSLKTIAHSFFRTSYIINLIANEVLLVLEIEDEDTGERWSGEFTAQCRKLLLRSVSF